WLLREATYLQARSYFAPNLFDDDIPVESADRVLAATLANLRSELVVAQQRHAGLCKRVRIVVQQDALAVLHREAFRAEAGSNDRPSVSCRFDDLEPGASSGLDRTADDPRGPIELVQVVNESPEFDSLRRILIGAQQFCSFACENQPSGWAGPSNAWPDIVNHMLRGVGVWRVRVSA